MSARQAPPSSVARSDIWATLGDHERRIRAAERSHRDSSPWIYVGSGGGAPDFQNGFFNVGSPRVLLRYRFLRPYDVELDPSALTPDAVQLQGSVAGGFVNQIIFTLLYPGSMPDNTPNWTAVALDGDRHLTCHDDSQALVGVTIQGASGNVILGFV